MELTEELQKIKVRGERANKEARKIQTAQDIIDDVPSQLSKSQEDFVLLQDNE